MSFFMFKMYLFMSICSKSENKHKSNHIYANVIVKCNLTKPRIYQSLAMTDICRTS